jgi:hypothetical protein
MRIIHLYDETFFLITDKQAEKLEKFLLEGKSKFVKVGDHVIAISQIKRLSPPDERPYFMGKPVKDESKIDPQYRDRIERKPYIPLNSINTAIANKKKKLLNK